MCVHRLRICLPSINMNSNILFFIEKPKVDELPNVADDFAILSH